MLICGGDYMFTEYEKSKLILIQATLKRIMKTICDDVSSKLISQCLEQVSDYILWMENKYTYKFKNKSDNKYIEKGEIYYCDFGENIGSEQNKIRPALILQNNMGNKHSTTTIVAPITHDKKFLPTHVNIKEVKPDCNVYGYVLLEQLKCVSKDRLREKVDKIDTHTVQWRMITSAIKIELEIKLNE